MSTFPIHTVDSAPSASRPLLQGLRDQVGFVPNLAASMATSPTLLQAFLSVRQVAAGGGLDPVAREIVAVAAATETGCTYCVAAHSTFALKQGAAPAEVAAARAGTPLGDPRLDALARFARAVVRRQKDVPERARELGEHGLGPTQVLDVLAAITVPLVAGLAHQLTAAPLEPLFQPQEWTPAG